MVVMWQLNGCKESIAGVVPRDWRRAVFIPIYKQGSRKLCKNYRGDQLAEYPWYRFCNNTQLSSVNSDIEDNVMEE